MATIERTRCDDCRMSPADFEAVARAVKPGRTKETKGTLAPWDRRFLCEPCAKRAATGDDPPRKLNPLPGYKPRHDPAPAPPANLTLSDAFKDVS